MGNRGPLARIPDVLWAPVVSAFLVAVVGVLGVVAGQPWLFPSLGPTAFMQAEYSRHRSSRFYNVLMGHLTGASAGLVAVLLLGAQNAPAITQGGTLSWLRICTAGLAVALTIVAQLILRASHPPAVSTALLFALGSFRPDLFGLGAVFAGALLVASLGELFRRVRPERSDNLEIRDEPTVPGSALPPAREPR